MKTLLLDRSAWDLVLDASGNIAVASEPYSLAQDVASAVKCFQGECWFDTTVGIPQWQILGQWPSLEFVRAQYVAAALKVPGVVKARCVFTSFKDRTLSGQIQVTDEVGNTQGVAF
jgi:hypothetical protein